MTSMQTCFFCGPTTTPLTEEHVWPLWVSKILRSPAYVDHFRTLHTEGDSTSSNRKSRYLSVTTETVCRVCNNKWLGTFENKVVKPIIGPLILGNATTALSSSSQSIMAAWAYKMALLLDLTLPDYTGTPFFTAEERREFRNTTAANPFVEVFLAKYAFGNHPAHAATPRHTMTEQFGQHRTLFLKVTTVTLGQVALQITGVRRVDTGELLPASEIAFEFLGKAQRAISRIWPPTEPSVSWPPAETMTVEDIEDWTGMWGRAHEWKAPRR